LIERAECGNLTPVTTKQKVLQAVQGLPDDATFEDAMQRLLFLAKIDRGLQQADDGQTIPHAQVKEKMAKWLD
jgi:predicted transcriptional regulator